MKPNFASASTVCQSQQEAPIKDDLKEHYQVCLFLNGLLKLGYVLKSSKSGDGKLP